MNCAFIVSDSPPCEGKDALKISAWTAHCLALQSGLLLGGQGEEENDGEAVELGEGDEGRLHGWKQRCGLISLLVLSQHGLHALYHSSG